MRSILQRSRIMPVVTLEDPATAVPVARALLAGGLDVIELMLRTPAALAALQAIANEVPEMQVGAGTVLDAVQIGDSVEAGAQFVVSPGVTPRLLQAAARMPVPYLPAIASASELMLCLEAGIQDCKLFPASVLGSKLAQALAGPFPNVRFCATGGITRSNAREFLGQANILTVGCSWIADPTAIAAGNWAQITANALEARASLAG